MASPRVPSLPQWPFSWSSSRPISWQRAGPEVAKRWLDFLVFVHSSHPAPHFHILLNLDLRPQSCLRRLSIRGGGAPLFWRVSWRPRRSTLSPMPSASTPSRSSRWACQHTFVWLEATVTQFVRTAPSVPRNGRVPHRRRLESGAPCRPRSSSWPACSLAPRRPPRPCPRPRPMVGRAAAREQPAAAQPQA